MGYGRSPQRAIFWSVAIVGIDYYRRLGYPKQANLLFRAQKQREREEVLTGLIALALLI